MTWLCPNCRITNVNFNKTCARITCRTDRPSNVDLKEDEFDRLLRETRQSEIYSSAKSYPTTPEENADNLAIAFLVRDYEKENTMSDEKSYEDEVKDIEANERMDAKEKLFATLFCHETRIVVKDMDMLTLRAHIEELSKIASEAKIRYSAAKAEEGRRSKQSSDGKPKGFERNLNADETSDAINTIKERQKRLTKAEKIREGLIKLGIDPDAADKIMSAKNILTQVTTNKQQNTTKPEEEVREIIPVFNPFEKKEG